MLSPEPRLAGPPVLCHCRQQQSATHRVPELGWFWSGAIHRRGLLSSGLDCPAAGLCLATAAAERAPAPVASRAASHHRIIAFLRPPSLDDRLALSFRLRLVDLHHHCRSFEHSQSFRRHLVPSFSVFASPFLSFAFLEHVCFSFFFFSFSHHRLESSQRGT